MVEINLYDYIINNSKLIFVDIVAKYCGRWVLCKKKGRDTWECPGGHIDKGETPEQAVKRELWEETEQQYSRLYQSDIRVQKAMMVSWKVLRKSLVKYIMQI